LEKKASDPNFWDNQNEVEKVLEETKYLKKQVSRWENLEKEAADLSEFAHLLRETEKEAETELQELAQKVKELTAKFEKEEISTFLSGKYDKNNAIVAIHAGTGGTDAQDWAMMLERMILRYTERKGFKTEILHVSPGSEAGIKSVVFAVAGPGAYGWLKSEKGVHRLVRLSPFNAKHLRQTSFALIEVIPEIPEPKIKISEKDLKIETFRSSGHGGQSVNTTDSAVRITHIPTGITVSVQNERSQIQNKTRAMKILASRLEDLAEQKEEQEAKAAKGEYEAARWGNQIRSYVLHPYQMVKDHRTGAQTADTEAVLNGEIDLFVEAFLRKYH
jgi:peptide chain release factor 2